MRDLYFEYLFTDRKGRGVYAIRTTSREDTIVSETLGQIRFLEGNDEFEVEWVNGQEENHSAS